MLLEAVQASDTQATLEGDCQMGPHMSISCCSQPGVLGLFVKLAARPAALYVFLPDIVSR